MASIDISAFPRVTAIIPNSDRDLSRYHAVVSVDAKNGVRLSTDFGPMSASRIYIADGGALTKVCPGMPGSASVTNAKTDTAWTCKQNDGGGWSCSLYGTAGNDSAGIANARCKDFVRLA